MKTIAFLIFVWVVMLAWVVSAMAIERRREKLPDGIVSSVGYPRCLPAPSAPVLRRGPVLHPGVSDLA